MLPLHCFKVVVQFEFEFFKFEFKLNLFESLAKGKKPLFSLKPQAGPAFFPSLFPPPAARPFLSPAARFAFLAAQHLPRARPISSSGPNPTPPPPAAHR